MFSAIVITLLLLLVWPAMSFLPTLGNFIARNLGIMTNPGGGNNDRSNPAGPASSSTSSAISDTQPDMFEPTPMDVVVARALLSEGLKLPHEIVLSILDFAEYWPHTSTVLDHPLTVSSGRGQEDRFVVSLFGSRIRIDQQHMHELTSTTAALQATWLDQKGPLR